MSRCAVAPLHDPELASSYQTRWLAPYQFHQKHQPGDQLPFPRIILFIFRSHTHFINAIRPGPNAGMPELRAPTAH